MRVGSISLQNNHYASKQQFAGLLRGGLIDSCFEGSTGSSIKTDVVEVVAKKVKRGRKFKAEKTVVEKQPQRSETEQRYHDSGLTTFDRLRANM